MARGHREGRGMRWDSDFGSFIAEADTIVFVLT